jgi:hypothetical protein
MIDPIVKALRNKRFENDRNDKVLNIITKLKAEVYNKVKRKSKEEKYNRKLKEINDKEIESMKEEEAPLESLVEEEPRPEVFLTWKMVSDEKKNISSNSHYIMSEKDLIDQVFESNLNNMSSMGKNTNRDKGKNKKQNMFDNLFLPIKGTGKVGDVAEMLKDGKYQEVGYYPRNLVIEAIEKIFNDEPEREYTEIVDILEALNFGDPNKRALLRLTKYCAASLPNDIRK